MSLMLSCVVLSTVDGMENGVTHAWVTGPEVSEGSSMDSSLNVNTDEHADK